MSNNANPCYTTAMAIPKKPSTLVNWVAMTGLSAFTVYWMMVDLKSDIALTVLCTGGTIALAFYLMYINYD
jgi:hypothetical protein